MTIFACQVPNVRCLQLQANAFQCGRQFETMFAYQLLIILKKSKRPERDEKLYNPLLEQSSQKGKRRADAREFLGLKQTTELIEQ